MDKRVRDAEAEVRSLNAELERRVAERTAELEAAYRQLAVANAELRARDEDSRRNRELLQSILDNATAVIFVKDLEGRYLLINKVYEELFHVGQEALVGCTDYDVFPPAIADAYRDADRKVLEAGCALQIEEMAPQDDGLHTYLSVKFPLCDAAGRPYAVCGIATDITERKRAEEQFRHVVEAAPNAMLLADKEGRISFINAQTEKLFGYSRDELIGQSVDILVPAASRAGHHANRDRYFARPSVRPMGADRELRGVHRDGHEIPIEIGLNPIHTEDGQHVLASITDITARKQAEAERLARQSAESSNRAKSEFLATMSHELRTPLNAILGYAQILKRDAGLTARQAAGLDTIQQSGQHLLALINDVLDLAKIEARKLDLDPAPIELAGFLRVVAEIVRVKAEEKNLLFAYEAPADLPAGVRVDGKRLRQVLLNLLSNAVKFTDHGRVSLTVRSLGTDGGSTRLRFEVADTGVGMSARQLRKLFQPFEQVGDAQRRAAGSGLGLAISQQLVRLMGGDIVVDSRPGAGSRFAFELLLPLAETTLRENDDALLAKLGEQLGLRWIHAEAGTAARLAASTPGTDMAIPPQDEIVALHRLALTGNMRAIRQHAEHLATRDERYGPFAEAIRRLAASYQSKAILSLVEGHLEQGPGS